MAGKDIELFIPVGVEKRIPGDLDGLALSLNAPGAQGLRLLPVAGEVITEERESKMLPYLQSG